MKKRSSSPVEQAVKNTSFLFHLSITLILLAAIGGCSQDTKLDPRLDDSQKAAVREVQGIAAAAANLLNVYMDARVTDLLVCSTTSDRLRQGLVSIEARDETNHVLAKWLKISGHYQAILLADKNGGCVASAPTGLVNRNVSDEIDFKDAVKGKLAISDAYQSDIVSSLDPESKGWTLSIAAPVFIGDEVAGVLMTCLKWSQLEQLVSSFKVGETGHIFLLNAQNQFIVHRSKILYGNGLRGPAINSPELDDAVRHKVSYKRYKYRMTGTATVGSDTITVIDKSSIGLIGFAYPRGYGNFQGLGWTVAAGVDEVEIVGGNWFWRLFRQ